MNNYNGNNNNIKLDNTEINKNSTKQTKIKPEGKKSQETHTDAEYTFAHNRNSMKTQNWKSQYIPKDL